MRYLLLLLPALLVGQTAEVAHISATRASVYIRGASGTCTGTLTNVDDSEVHPYVNGVDLSTLADYVTWRGGTRVVTLGRETGDDALRAERNHSFAITCGGTPLDPVTFRTPPVYFGTVPGRAAPWDSSRYGNRAWPRICLTRACQGKVYTDPLTGLAFRMGLAPGTWGMRNPYSSTGADFYKWAGGTNWTNPSNVGNGGTATYGSVATTDPLDLFFDPADSPWHVATQRINVMPTNVGIQVFGKGGDADGANRSFKVGIHDGTDYLLHQTIPLASGTIGAGSVAQLLSASSDSAKVWPGSATLGLDFLDAGYGGWTVTTMPGKNHIPLSGAVDSAASVTGTVDGPFTITGSNNTLVLVIDGGSNQTVTFTTGTRTTQNIVDEINAQTTGVTASVSGSRVRLTSDTSRNCPTECSALMSVASTIARDASSTALSVLGFTSGTTTGGNGGRITVSSGNTLLWDGTVSSTHHIPLATKAGSKVWVKNSSCPNEICTVASVVDYRTITVSETITDGSYSIGYAIYPIWVRVEKTTATGTIELGLRYKTQMLERMLPNAARRAMECGPWTVNDGTKAGELCMISSHSGPNGPLHFLSHDFSVSRMLSTWAMNMAGAGAKFTGWAAADIPSAAGDRFRAKFFADPSNPGVWYALATTANTGSGSKNSLYKIQYNLAALTDDFTPGLMLNSSDGANSTDISTLGNDNVTYTNLMKPSGGVECGRAAGTGCDLAAQMAVLNPSDPEWAGANWNSSPTELVTVTGPYAIVYNRSGNNGQDASVCLFAVIRLSDGQVVNHFSSGKGVTVAGYNSRLRWGSCHTTYGGIFDSSLLVSQNDLGHKSGGGLFGGPFLVTPSHIKMGDGSWVAVGVDRDGAGPQTATGTRMDWPTGDPANTYDRNCPTDIADWLKDYGATGTQCATFRIPNDPTCTSCTNPAMSMALEVGDKLGKAGNYDSEKLRVVKITSLGGTEKEIVVSRNATFDWGCMNNDPDSPRSTYCSNTDDNQTWADGFSFRTESGQTNSSNDTSTTLQFNPDGSGAITYIGETSQSSSGHTAFGAYTGSRKLFSGFGESRILTAQSEFDTKYPMGDVIPYATPTFGSVVGSIGDGRTQAYFDRSHAQASDVDLGWTMDANALNPNDGSVTNIGTRTITAATGSDVWEVQELGTVDYKARGLLGWSGPNALKDVSPADISAAPYYSMCHVYRAGDCGQGSVGQTFVKVPMVNSAITTCETGMMWANVPCVYGGHALAGGVRRFLADKPDGAGRNNQFLSHVLAGPGLQTGYTGATAGAGGKFFGTSVSNYIDGIWAGTVIGKMPSWNHATTRNTYGGLSVNVGKITGMTHARVRFGYGKDFYCTERSEACLTDGVLTPFAFAGDTLTNVACDGATGCTITVPAIPGRLTYYRLETYNGSSWSSGDTLTAVP